MSDVLTLFAFLELLGAASKGGQQGPPGPPGPPAQGAPPGVGPSPVPTVVPVPTPGPAVMPPPGDIGPFPVPVPTAPVAPPVAPGVLPPMPPWPSPPTPGTLPPYPGPGWCPDTPVTTAVANRAAFWNPQLWDYTTKTQRRAFVQEQFGGSWVTFAAAWHPGTAGPKTYMATEAYRLCTAPPIAPPTPVTPATPAPAPPMGKPGPVGPSPGPGTWQTNAPFIQRYQAALTWLSQQGNPAFNPQGIDGKFGPNTSAAVKAFQAAHGLSPVDGEVGPATSAALDTAMGYTAVAPPSPVAPAPHPAAAPGQPAPPPNPPIPLPPPPQVQPYPGTGAWQTNAPYITRYQSALTWLAYRGLGPFDPQGVDGKFGPNTSAAVKSFQQAHGLSPVDGEAGAATAAAIDAVVVATLAANHGAPGAPGA